MLILYFPILYFNDITIYDRFLIVDVHAADQWQYTVLWFYIFLSIEIWVKQIGLILCSVGIAVFPIPR